MLGGVSLIPIVGMPLSARAATPMSYEFMGMPAPTTPEAMAMTTVESSVAVTFNDGSKQTFKLAHKPFFLTGDQVPDGKGGTMLAGGYYDMSGKPIMDPAASPNTPLYSDAPDGHSLLTVPNASVPGVTGNPVFAVVQFEYMTRDAKDASLYGMLPSPIAVLTLDQNKQTGELKLVKYHNVDTAPAHGLWITCGASLSPWGTHLSSEEYEPDATKAASDKQFLAYSKFTFGDETKANPYHYGHIPEVTVRADGTASIKKHYGLGRISHELIAVMPDQRTVLMGDDASHGSVFMFVADKAADLSAGTLYVAKLAQTSAADGGAFDLTWINIGHATSDEIQKLADTTKPADLLDVKTADPNDASYDKINYNGAQQWVKFKPGMEKAAAFLETHRWAAKIGATAALTKLEGVTVNAKDKTAYMALQNIYRTMSDGSGGIKVDAINAGAVMQLPLQGGKSDTAGTAIDSEWVPVKMSAVPELVGKDIPSDAVGNLADPNRVGNPDNVKFSEKMRTLFIGEDSAQHVNNFLWAFNVDTKKLSRLLSTPIGAESTGLHAVDNVNGFAYIMSNFQHPGDWEKGLHDKMKDATAALIDKNFRNRRSAAVGYIQGLPQQTA